MKKFVIYLSIMFSGVNIYANSPSTILGTWENDEKNIHIRTYIENEKLHAKIIWLKDAFNENGEKVKDVKNPDRNLRSRTIEGLDLLYGYKYKNGVWENGKIYNVSNGKVYGSYLQLSEHDELLLTGYLGAKWLGKTVTWTRVH